MADVEQRLAEAELKIRELMLVTQRHGARLNDLRAAMRKQNDLNKHALELYKQLSARKEITS